MARPTRSIASHDLEIRGAGNLLGPDQSGSIAAIGFDLYSQLLDEAVSEMRGEPPVHVDTELRLRVGQPPVPVEEQFLVAGQLALVTSQDALQREVR